MKKQWAKSDQNYDKTFPLKNFLLLLKENNINFIDLKHHFDIFKKESIDELYFKYDNHLNIIGHSLIADIVFRKINTLLY